MFRLAAAGEDNAKIHDREHEEQKAVEQQGRS